MGFLLTIFSLVVLLFSVIIHEIAHGSVAFSLGDPTAKYANRLTLNPIKHLDLVGSIFLPLFLLLITRGRGPIFGWAKPVPINPYNFKNPKLDEAKVAIAGPGSNILIALIFGLPIRFFFLPPSLFIFFSIIVILNLLLALFNLVPIPPLDGSHILFTFLPERWRNLEIFLKKYGIFILIFFISFFLNFIYFGVEILYSIICGKPIIM